MTASKNVPVIFRASAGLTGRLMPITPPNAETGSPAQRQFEGLRRVAAHPGAAGVVVLDDDREGAAGKVARGGPGGLEIEEIVERELLAPQLRRAGDADARPGLAVEGGALVRVLAVAQILDLHEGQGERRRVRRRRRDRLCARRAAPWRASRRSPSRSTPCARRLCGRARNLSPAEPTPRRASSSATIAG